jgi:hypothetical protein
MTYYRNGLASGNNVATGSAGAPPLYFGGDADAGENWQGLMDDVAVWTDGLPTQSIAGLAGGMYDPQTAPTTGPAGPLAAVIFSDDFTADAVDTAKWAVTDRGLENNAPAGYDPPSTTANPDQLTLGGATSSQYWYGSSLESVPSFDSSQATVVTVDRVSLSGSGTAWRSSLWILGDDDHYLHFAQNVGENGWQYNANDAGGVGTLGPTGGGNNLVLLDPLDGDGGAHEMMVHVAPTGTAGEVNMEMYLDGDLVGVHGFSNFPAEFKVVLTGQARAGSDTVSAVFDNLSVTVPEPGTIFMLAGLGLSLLLAYAGRWRNRTA